MSADPRVERYCAPTSTLAEALYFDSGEKRLFGWLHQSPARINTNTGLVICNPFGYESICAHRGIRTFAEAAAKIGIPALRFDYLGTGDSADVDPHANQLEIWSQDVIAAVAELQRRTGVEQVCLLGFRMGALLAAVAASQCKAVTALILVAPIVSGKRYVRELRITRMAGLMSANGETADDIDAQTGSIEVSGFSLSAATLGALRRVDLMSAEVAPARKMLLIDGHGFSAARPWSEALVRLGREATYLVLPGLVEMIMTAPHGAAVPHEMIEAACGWLLQTAPAQPLSAQSGAPRRFEPGSPGPACLTLPGDSSAQQACLTERPVFFDSGAVLFGIVTEPRQDETRRRAVILLNAGADYHIGASRMYVSLARRWARRGYVVLRIDIGGVGDSSTRLGTKDDDVFPAAALKDISAAIEFLRRRYDIADITLAGLCSGAYHALRAAVAGQSVNRILMVNPQNYFWKKGMSLDDLQLAEVVRNPGVYREQVFSGAAWKRLLSGKVNIWRIFKIVVQRPLLALESVGRDVARVLRIHLPYDLGWELEEIVARGVRVVFLFAQGEPGIDLLKIEGGSSVKRLGDSCRVRIIPNGDHVFSHGRARAQMESILSEELFSRTDWSAPTGGIS